MTSQVSTKVRLVRCPKCRQVLAELPEVPLYTCGGCGTVLQAKNRKLETNATKPSSQETDTVAESGQDYGLKANSSNKAPTSQTEVESLSDKDNISRQDENSDSAELREDTSVVISSPEIAFLRSENSPTEANNNFSEHDSVSQFSKIYHSKFHNDNCEPSQAGKFSDDIPSSGEFAIEDTNGQMEGGESQRAWQKGNDFVTEVNNSPEHEFPESVLPLEGKKDNHVSPKNENTSRIHFANQNEDFCGEYNLYRNASHENGSTSKNMNTSVSDSKFSSRSPSKESLVSFYLTSPDNENPDHFPSEVTRNFGRLDSLDTLGSLSLPTTKYPKIASYYTYDGSESSYDGSEDQIRQHISQLSRKNKDVDIRNTEMRMKKNGFRGNNIMNSEPEWGPTSSPHRATMRNNHWSQSIETNRYAGGNRMRLDEQEGVSRLAFSSRSGPVPGPTSYQHGSLPPRPFFKPSYPEPDKTDLLRTVCELQDQLSRMHFPQVRSYNQYLPDRDIYSDVHHPHGYNLCHNQPKVSAEQHYGSQISRSCLHCCPGQDWRYSAHLAPHNSMHHNKGPHGVHSDHPCCNDISNSSSPRRYRSSEAALWGYETKPDDQIKRARSKEKYFTDKKHIRPVAGGAPVVACYHCSELLLLPADFLLFSKKYHPLMCDACKKVLRFSLMGGRHIVPYVPGASAPPPPPSEVDGYNVAAKNTESLSHSSSFRRVNRPVSCSEDYGDQRSIGVSCSTEGEYYTAKMMSSGSSYDAVEDRKMKSMLIESRDEEGSLVNGDGPVGPSSKITKSRKLNLKSEETASSPLHRLMGYSSPSQVF